MKYLLILRICILEESEAGREQTWALQGEAYALQSPRAKWLPPNVGFLCVYIRINLLPLSKFVHSYSIFFALYKANSVARIFLEQLMDLNLGFEALMEMAMKSSLPVEVERRFGTTYFRVELQGMQEASRACW
jgi:hypothetical protein